MRLHILVDDAVVAELDQRVGRGRRSSFVAQLIREALDDARRWDDLESGFGSLEDSGHDWDIAAGDWVRSQRREDPRRVG